MVKKLEKDFRFSYQLDVMEEFIKKEFEKNPKITLDLYYKEDFNKYILVKN